MVVSSYHELDDDDEPTLYGSDGLEYGVCLVCQELTVLEDLLWDGLCKGCDVNGDA